jgi:nitrite reductase/ring-hydroxylating ferredoxin subunit
MPQSTDRRARIEQLSDEEVLVSVDDRKFVVAAACPHRKGRLAYAHINATTLRITCPLHRSTYDLATGCRVSGPATGDLPVREHAAAREPSC